MEALPRPVLPPVTKMTLPERSGMEVSGLKVLPVAPMVLGE